LREAAKLLAQLSAIAELARRLHKSPAMTDENYTALLLWTICVLTFACGVVALTQHPEWFGA
jgi:hypothetical protein